MSKTIEKTKKTKQPKRSISKPSKTIWKTKKNTKKNKTFGPMTLFGDIGPKVCLFLFCLVFPMVFDGFGIDLFGCFGFVGFPNGF